jgi:hypothetical protein
MSKIQRLKTSVESIKKILRFYQALNMEIHSFS